jgi:hypothetical protein
LKKNASAKKIFRWYERDIFAVLLAFAVLKTKFRKRFYNC